MEFEREDGSTYSFGIRKRMIRSRPYENVWKKEILESPDGFRYMSIIPRSLEGCEELKFLPHGPYILLPDCDYSRVQAPTQTEAEASLQQFKRGMEALRKNLRQLEKRLDKIEKSKRY
jgi:hypothetical protein